MSKSFRCLRHVDHLTGHNDTGYLNIRKHCFENLKYNKFEKCYANRIFNIFSILSFIQHAEFLVILIY